jgi:uncharacterized protein DUF4440
MTYPIRIVTFVIAASLGLLGLVPLSFAGSSSDAEAERYIKESESQWAESVANGDASVVERILADDFLGVDPDGNLYEKAKMVADMREAPKEFISNHLNDVKVRFFGDTAVAQGDESWVRRTGTPLAIPAGSIIMDRILIAILLTLLLAALPIWWPYGRRGRSSPSDTPTRLESRSAD